MILSPKVLSIDPRAVESQIKSFIKSCVREASVDGVVVGMSGGVDSSLTAALCSKAVGGDKVLGITLPEEATDPTDIRNAKNVAKRFGIKHIVIDVTPIVKEFFGTIPLYDPYDKVSNGNVKARTRMIILYYYANHLNRLVIGTSNKSEFLTGYFTKYGDAGVDVIPLGDLYKTQVKQLATYVGIPKEIIERPPSAGLWPGQLDEEELGVKYAVLDLILYGLEHKMNPREIAKQLKISPSLVRQITSRRSRTEHKRCGPLTLKLRY